MFFKPEMKEAILADRKTETRRIWKRPRVKVGGIYKVRKNQYSKEFYFKIRVFDVFKQRLGDMTEEDAMAEGFTHYDENPASAMWFFRDYWNYIHGKGSWNPDQEVYVVRFEKVVD